MDMRSQTARKILHFVCGCESKFIVTKFWFSLFASVKSPESVETRRWPSGHVKFTVVMQINYQYFLLHLQPLPHEHFNGRAFREGVCMKCDDFFHCLMWSCHETFGYLIGVCRTRFAEKTISPVMLRPSTLFTVHKNIAMIAYEKSSLKSTVEYRANKIFAEKITKRVVLSQKRVHMIGNHE